MSRLQCTLALLATCLVQVSMNPNDWDVSVRSSVQAIQGMSVTFYCSFQYPFENIPSSDITGMWLHDPCDSSSPTLYSSENPGNEDVNFIGDLGRKNCSLQINDVKANHGKTYCFRFTIQDKNKWTGLPGVTLRVYARPTKPIISYSTELVEGVTTKLICSSSEIDDEVKCVLNWHGLGDETAMDGLTISNNRKLTSTVNFMPSYRNHNKIIKCSVNCREYSFMDETQETLKVKYAPKNITTQVNGRSQWEIKEGDWVSLTCGSSSNPEASYTWYKRDQGEDEAFNTKNGSLLFQSILPSASGFYKCTATNYLGNLNTETVEIRVQYAPKNVTVQVEGTSQLDIKEGDKISLTCASNSDPDATYTWYKSDKGQVQMLDYKNCTLIFQNISQSASGFYSCTAANYLGNLRSEAVEIRVQYAPKNVTVQVEGTSQLDIKEGDKISLTCASNSDPDATYTWYKSDKGQVQTLYSKNCTLIFQNISQSASGFYSCTAANYLGNLSSEAVEIRVQYAPKNVTVQVEGTSQLEIKEGDKVSLTCTSNSDPESTYTWDKQDEGEVNVFNSKNGTLLFQSISQSASGFYKCTATNYLGHQSSETVEICVQHAPRNVTIHVKDRSEVEIKEADNISLICASHSYPEAAYTWNRRMGDNDQTMTLIGNGDTMVFHNISRRDSGLYACTASNYLGHYISEDWEISVHYKPTHVNLTRDGMSFRCTAEANPPARISWNNTDMTAEVLNGTWTTSTLVLQTMTSGCVSCRAQNKLGFIHSEERCFKSTRGAILGLVIVGSIAAILVAFGILLWTQRKKIIKRKMEESETQPVIYTTMQNLPEACQTSNSDITGVYDNLCKTKSGERKWTFSKKGAGDVLEYASLRFASMRKGLKAARRNPNQGQPDDAQQVTVSDDDVSYENMVMIKTTVGEVGDASKDPGETTLYACIKGDDLQTKEEVK
ncbi:B-cell receptor CD22-like isoform X1 [Amblyraja radiata]|uniref:B-cell receptor CD22-like isoform X1 n=1 Tax=Amblyraja radiata TaxID=386614 RepID=UPI001402B8CA|nr:B-cell receptor CD22-like isoform X1 [Amblyraja radiata]